MDIEKKIKSEYNRKYREEHKEHLKELNKKYYEAHKDKYKKYYQDNKEMLKEYNRIYQRQYRKDNKEKVKEYKKVYMKQWRKIPENKNRQAEITQKYISRTAYAPKHHKYWTVEEERMVLNPNMTLHDLALKMGRSEQAVNLKRVRLRKCGISTSTVKEVIDNE